MAVAPSYAATQSSGHKQHVPGDLREAIVKATVGASDTYATSGFTVAASALNLTKVDFVHPIHFSNGYWAVNTATLPATTLTFKVYTAGSGAAAPAELGNASTVLQSAVFYIHALGK